MAIIQSIQALNMNSAFAVNNSGTNMRTVTRDGDSANFTNAAKDLAVSGDGINGSVATASNTLGGAQAKFNFANGSLTIGSTTFDLKGFANLSKDDVTIQAGDTAGTYKVFKGSEYVVVDGSGKMQTEEITKTPATPPVYEPDGTTIKTPGKDAVMETVIKKTSGSPTDVASILINNSGATMSGSTSAANTVFARMAGSGFSGGSATDKIFAYGGVSGNIDTKGGDDALYTSKITGGTVNMSDGKAYVETKSATGGTVNLGDSAIFNADKGALGGVTINAASGSGTMTVLAKSMSNTKIDFSNAKITAIDVAGGIGGGSNLKLGTETNSLVANSISGQNISISTGIGATNALNILGGVSGLTYTGGSGSETIAVKGAVNNSKIDLGDGSNSLNVSGAVSKSSVMAASGTASKTAFKATSFNGGTADVISLGDGGNLVDLKGALNNATVNLGSGENNVFAGSVKDVTMTVGGTNATGNNLINISGAVNGLNYTGNAGNDELNIKSAVTKSSIDLGNGKNSISAAGSMTLTGISAGASATTSLTLGSFTGDATKGISLGGGGNTVNIKGALSGGTIDLGTGANSLSAARIAGTNKNTVTLNMGGAGTNTQTVNISGAASYLTYNGGKGDDTLNVEGNISNSTLNLGDGKNTVSLLKTVNGKTSAFDLISTNISAAAGTNSTTTVNARAFSGNKSGSGITLGDGSNALNFSGKVGMASVDMGTGSNTFNAGGIGGTKNFSVKLQMGGANTLDQNVNITGAVNYFDYMGGNGNDKLKILGNVSNSNINLGSGGTDEVTMRGVVGKATKESNFNLSNTSILATGNGGTTIKGGSVSSKGTNSISLGNGGNTLDFSGKITSTNLDLGTGSNKLYAGGLAGGKDAPISVIMGGSNSASDQTMRITGAVSKMLYTGSASGADTLNLLGTLSNSTINMGSGASTLNMSGSVGKSDKIKDFGMSNVSISAGGSTFINAASINGKKDDPSTITLTGQNNSVAFSGTANNFTISMGSGATSFEAKSVNKGSLTAMGNSNTITIGGSATGLTYVGGDGYDAINMLGNLSKSDINLGSGANTLNLGGTVGKTNPKYKTFNISTTNISAGEGVTNITANSLSGSGKDDYSIILGNSGDASAGSTINLAGKISNMKSIVMGSGANTLNAKGIEGGKNGINVMMGVSAAGGSTGNTLNISGAVNNLTYTGSSNADALTVLGNMKGSTIDLGSGTNSLNMQTTTANNKTKSFSITSSTINVATGAASVSITAGAVGGTSTKKSSLSLGGGDNVLNIASLSNTAVDVAGGLNMTIDKLTGIDLTLGTGSNTIQVNKTLGAAGTKGAVNLDFSKSATGTTQSLTVSGAVNNVTYKGGDGNDVLKFGGSVTNLTADLGSGSNSVEATSSTSFMRGSTITGSGGNNTITLNNLANSGTKANSISLSGVNATVNVFGSVTGTKFDIDSKFANLSLGDIKGGTTTPTKVSINDVSDRTATNSGSFTLTAKTINNTAINVSAGDVKITTTKLNNSNITLGENVADVLVDVSSGGSINKSTIKALGGDSATIKAQNVSASTLELGAAVNKLYTDKLLGANNKLTLLAGTSELNVSSGMATTTMSISTNAGDVTFNGGATSLIQASSISGGGTGAITFNVGSVEKSNINLSAGTVAFNVTTAFNSSTASITATGNASLGGAALKAEKSNITMKGAMATLQAASLNGGKAIMQGTNTLLNVGSLTKVEVEAGGTNNTVGSSDYKSTFTGGTLKAAGVTTILGTSMEGVTVAGSGTSLTIDLANTLNANINLGSGSGSIYAKTMSGKLSNQIGDDVFVKVSGAFTGSTNLSGTGSFTMTVDSIAGATVSSTMQNNTVSVTKGVSGSKVDLQGGGVNKLSMAESLTKSTVNLGTADSGLSTFIASGGASDSTVNLKSAGTAELYAQGLNNMTVDMKGDINLLNATATGKATGSEMKTGSAGNINNSTVTMTGTKNDLTVLAVQGTSGLTMTGTNTLYATNLGGKATLSGGSSAVNVNTLSGNLTVNGTDAGSTIAINSIAGSGALTAAGAGAGVTIVNLTPPTDSTTKVASLSGNSTLDSTFDPDTIGSGGSTIIPGFTGVTVGTGGNYTSHSSLNAVTGERP